MTPRERALQRALQLVMQATDPSTTEAESRTFALVACKLIREHNLLTVPSENTPIWRNIIMTMVDGLDVEAILRGVAEEVAQPSSRTTRTRSKPPPPPPPPPRPRPRPRAPIDPLEREHRIRQQMDEIRVRVGSMPEEKIRSAAIAAVDAAIAQGR